MRDFGLGDQVAIVTGASRGIGRAIAEALAAAGARVVLAARRAEPLVAAAAAIESHGGKAHAVATDVTVRGDVQHLIDLTLERYGRLDILVNNAGRSGSGRPLAEIDDEEWRRVLDGNLTGTFYCCRAALPAMLRAGYGRIVNVSSRVGLAAHVLGSRPGAVALADYAVAKAGVVALTKALAHEVAPNGITVNAVAPGPVVTEMLMAVGEEEVARRAALVPVGRLGRPEDIARAVLYLVGPDSGFVTGAVLNVNGGTWMG